MSGPRWERRELRGFGMAMRGISDVLRPRTRDVKARFARALEKQVWPLLEAGRVKIVMDSTFPLAQASEAHKRMETSQHVGKIVLTV